MIFIDRNGEKFEPELMNAILNSVEIDTRANVQNELNESSEEKGSSSNNRQETD